MTTPPQSRPRVPRAFHEEHELDVASVYRAPGRLRGERIYRAGGTCSCGALFGTRAGRHNMRRSDVLAAHKDHVVAAWEARAAS